MRREAEGFVCNTQSQGGVTDSLEEKNPHSSLTEHSRKILKFKLQVFVSGDNYITPSNTT